MHNDEGRLLLWSFVGFGGGIYTFLKGFRQFRTYRLVADTPAIRIRSVPMGLVQIRGEACAEESLLSPVTHTPCCLYKVVIEEWHHDSEHGGEWKHIATDVKGARFRLRDDSGSILVDPINSELDLPPAPVRKIHSRTTAAPPTPAPVPAATAGTAASAATDDEILRYIEQARLRHFTQMVGKGAGMLGHGREPGHESTRQSFLDMLADPTGKGGDGFRGLMTRAMLARHDPTGQTQRLALEVWKHPQGTPEFESALVEFARAYVPAMMSNKPNQMAIDSATVMAQVQQHPELLGIVANIAGAAEPQSDPQAETARQTALAFGHTQLEAMAWQKTPTQHGEYRLTESCLVPGQTYDITGTCVENPEPRDEHDRNLIVKGANEPTFLISSRAKDKEVNQWLRTRSIKMVFGGAALALVCLAIILGKLGMF